jgi:hypothetical protein
MPLLTKIGIIDTIIVMVKELVLVLDSVKALQDQ